MLRTILTFIGRLYRGIMSMLLSVLLGFALWGCWGIYREQALDAWFLREGHPVRITIEQTSDQPRSWRDQLSQTTYLMFRYRQHSYTARFVTDTIRAEVGDHVSLLYHPELDAFRQPGQVMRFQERSDTSRLIRWSVLATFSQEHKWLVLCVTLSVVFLLFTAGTIVTLTGWTLWPGVGSFWLVVFLLGGTAFVTYDSWQYVQYYGHLKAYGQPTQVNVVGTNRTSYYSRSRRYGKSYLYTARVQCGGRQRIIPLEEAAYELLRPGDKLLVLYDPSVDDLMPVNYDLDYRQFLLTVLAWVLTLGLAWRKQWRRAKAPHLPSP